MEIKEREIGFGKILMLTLLICGTFTYYLTHEPQKQQPADDEEILVQPPNYDKGSLLELIEKGECAGGTIEEGKFSIFICKE